ncbi:AmiS/UreI family transporter [Pimelobacter simplex]|uniref:AmiS/UreI family transporter n=1 Tax=Nocardioides simplex TaxID=2045 RepID=UPI0021504DB0|nr:AmiS/UreI family transporter [Pimelobacter simplex]UUW92519.1 hypothetical protein M0M43_13840 [Pimelobacter simplex]UUW96347.1 hypothetical protein M0M48_02475 [Pimelobacter simplex]
MIAPILLFVGAVLAINGIWIYGGAAAAANGQTEEDGATSPIILGGREVGLFNLFVGSLGFILAVTVLIQSTDEPAGSGNIAFGAFALLFAFTYLWVGANPFLNADGKTLGWFCLFVAITAAANGVRGFTTDAGHASSWSTWLSTNWIVWAVLWLLFFALLSLGKQIGRLTGVLTVVVGLCTCWLPAYLLLQGIMSPV